MRRGMDGERREGGRETENRETEGEAKGEMRDRKRERETHIFLLEFIVQSFGYLKQRASLNSSLWRSKPNSLRGRAVSQVDAPLSLATSNNRSRSGAIVHGDQKIELVQKIHVSGG